jgi:hypothetical protein
MGGWNLPQSKWANLFTVKEYGLEVAVNKYREYVLSNQELYHSLLELKGKHLVCWYKPAPCHGNILVDLLNKLDSE